MTVPLLAPSAIPEVESRLSAPLAQLFTRLDAYRAPISVPTLVDHLTCVDLPQAAFSDLTDFDPGTYTRSLLHVGPAYEALILCWLPDQRSAIHDHHGSNCAFRVLMGTATETLYSVEAEGMARPGERRCYTTGFVAASSDADVHRVSNLDGEDLVTLHVYSPPLKSMRTYRGV